MGHSTSLKDKRRVIQSILDRARKRWNLSVSEVEYQDDRQWTRMAFVNVGSNRQMVERELQQVLVLVEDQSELEVYESDITFV